MRFYALIQSHESKAQMFVLVELFSFQLLDENFEKVFSFVPPALYSTVGVNMCLARVSMLESNAAHAQSSSALHFGAHTLMVMFIAGFFLSSSARPITCTV